jgi:hypothetical protein
VTATNANRKLQPPKSMKTRRFLFVVLGFGALTLRLSFADEPAKASPQHDPHDKNTMPVHPAGPPRITGDRTDRKHFLLNAVGHDSNWNSQPRSVPGLTKRTTANGFRPPVLKKPATAANQPLLNKPATYSMPPARLLEGREIAAPFPHGVPGRAATAATLGGLTASSAKNSTAALNGTTLKRKP